MVNIIPIAGFQSCNSFLHLKEKDLAFEGEGIEEENLKDKERTKEYRSVSTNCLNADLLTSSSVL